MRTDIHAALRAWIEAHTEDAFRIDDDTDILEGRVLDSLQLTDLILYVEELRDAPLDAEQLNPEAFRTVNAIYRQFFEEDA